MGDEAAAADLLLGSSEGRDLGSLEGRRVDEFDASETKALTSALLSNAEGLRQDVSTRPQATMLAELAAWLQQRLDELKTVNFHGI